MRTLGVASLGRFPTRFACGTHQLAVSYWIDSVNKSRSWFLASPARIQNNFFKKNLKLIRRSIGALNALRGLSQWERDRFKWTSKTRRHWSKKNGMKSSCWSALRHELLSREQVRMCIKHPQLMSTVWEAAVTATVSCRDAFADRRWNCSSIDTIPRLTPDLTQGGSLLLPSPTQFIARIDEFVPAGWKFNLLRDTTWTWRGGFVLELETKSCRIS